MSDFTAGRDRAGSTRAPADADQEVASRESLSQGRLADGLVALALTGAVLLTLGLAGALQAPEGDDVYFHIANARFVSENWPHVWWYPNSHAGEPLMSQYPVTVYFVLAVLNQLGISLETLFRSLLASSFVLIALANFAVARSMHIGRALSAGIALLPFTGASLWNVSLIGGAYIRVAGLPALFLSLGATYHYLSALQREAPTRRAHAATVVSLIAVGLVHPFLFQFAALIVASLVVMGVDGWVRRGRALLSVFLPACAAIAWQYVPIVSLSVSESANVPGAIRHDVTRMEPEWLFVLPTKAEFSITLGPLLFGVALVALLYVLFLRRRLRHDRDGALLMRLTVTLLGWVGYFIAFAWLPLPAGLYLMAAYDYVFWAALAISMLGVVLAALASRATPRGLRGLDVALPVAAILVVAASFPWIESASFDAHPRHPGTVSQATAKVVAAVREREDPSGYRLGAVTRTFTRWLPYDQPAVDFVGGRSSISPHRAFYDRMVYEAFFRRDHLARVYFEDRPKVEIERDRAVVENYYRAFFWLEWYGARSTLMDVAFTPLEATAAGYAARSQFAAYRSVPSGYGSLAYARVEDRHPVTMATDGAVVAVPYTSEETDPHYVSLLSALSNLDVGPRYVVPLRLPDGEGLELFDAALTDRLTYARHRGALDGWVARGGRLVVTDLGRELRTREVRFGDGLWTTVSASAVGAVDDVRARSRSQPIAGCSSHGRGSLCALGAEMQTLGEGDPSAILLLLDLLTDHRVRVVSGTGRQPRGSREVVFSLQRPVLASARGFVEVVLKDAPRRARVRVSALGDKDGDVLSAALEVSSGGQGVQRLRVPLAALTTTGTWRSRTITSLETRISRADRRSAIEGARVATLADAGHDVVIPRGRWRTPTSFGATLAGDRTPRGLLWKQSHTDSWDARVDGDERPYFFAGPGMVYVPLEDGDRSVSFAIGIPPEYRWGFALSGALAVLCLGLWLRTARQRMR